MLFYLVLSVMILFTSFYLYKDIKNKINTGNTFAEGFDSSTSEELLGNKGEGYRGKQNRTRSGRICQKWTSQSPQKHSRTPEKYPNKGLGDHNFCRNPDGGPSIWCYTEDSNKRWELCEPLKKKNVEAPKGYKYTGESQCQDWNSNYVVCKTALDGKNCGIKATTKEECAAECDKRDSCGEMYFKNGVCYLANGKCVPQINPKNPQPHYKKIKQDNSSSTCLQPPPPKVDANKCITPDQLSWGSKIMSMLNGVAGKSKCVDSAAVKKVTETAGPDLILALGAANKHLRQAQPHLQAALKDAQPHLNNAFSKSQTHMGSVFLNPVTQSQQTGNVSGNEVQKVEDNNLPTQNTEASQPQEENTVLENAELATQGTNSDELNSQIIQNNNARPEQQRQKFTDKHFTMPNGNIVLPSKGNCPNGCKAPTYDSESCANQIFMDKEYRNCPWVDEKGNSGSCQGCGAVLLPKNKYGYARTRPGFFSDKTVKNILDQNDFSSKDKKDSVDIGNNLTVGKDFMSELASQKKFNIPNISNAEYQQLGKLVQKYQLAGGDSITNKFNLTNAVNSLLNTNPLASNLLENKDDSNNPNGEKTENIPSNQPVDKIVGNSYKKRSINKNDSAEYNTAYTTTYKPIDPNSNSHPNPYNSLWGSL